MPEREAEMWVSQGPLPTVHLAVRMSLRPAVPLRGVGRVREHQLWALGEGAFTAQRVLPLLGCSETASLLTLLRSW